MDRARDRGLGRGADHYLQLGLHLRCPGRARPRARPARTLSRTGLGRPRMDPERQRSRVVARQSALPRRAGTHPLMEEPVMPASPLHRFFTELRRRRVIRVAIVYAVAGWVIVEVASTVLPPLDLPDWSVRLVIVLVALGFPIAVIMGWMFDLGPGGLAKEDAPSAVPDPRAIAAAPDTRSEEHTSELPSLMRISYAVFCLIKK